MGSTGLGTASLGLGDTLMLGRRGSHLGEGLGRLRAVADLEAEPVEAVVPGRGVRPVDPQPLWCLLQCLHRHVERGVGLHCWGSRGRRGLALRCSAAAAPGKRGAALTDAAEGDDPVLAGRAASAVADACGYHKGFGVIGARGHLQPADKLSRLGEVAAPLLCGVPSCEPAATWLSWGRGTRQAQGSPVWHGAKGTTKSRAGGSQPWVGARTVLTSASPRASPASPGMASLAAATRIGRPCRGSAGSRRPEEFRGALQGREALGDRGARSGRCCEGSPHPSADPPSTSSRRERSRRPPTEQP